MDDLITAFANMDLSLDANSLVRKTQHLESKSTDLLAGGLCPQRTASNRLTLFTILAT